MKGIIALAGLVIIGWFLYGTFLATDYSKPWFEGERAVRICKVPYYDNSECRTATAISDGSIIVQIKASNGQSFMTFDNSCHKAAEGMNDYDRFCRFTEQSGDRWDVLP